MDGAHAIDEATTWDVLPAAICSKIVALLDTPDVIAVSSTCSCWRTVVQSSITSLAPRTVLAMPFVGGCSSLRRLQLGQAVPTAPSGPFNGFSHIAAVTNLTALCLDTSSTMNWRGTAACLEAEQLQHIASLTLLQVLNLNHQTLLSAPGALKPLVHLKHLTKLLVDSAGDSWHLPHSSWTDIAALTGLKHLDVSGCDQCWVDKSSSLTAPFAAGNGDVSPAWINCSNSSSGGRNQSSLHVAAAASVRTSLQELVPAPLHLMSSLSRLQSVILADWKTPPSAEGMRALSLLPALTALDLLHCLDCSTIRNHSGAFSGLMLDLMKGTHCSQQQKLKHQRKEEASVHSNSSGSREPCFFSQLQSLACGAAVGHEHLLCSEALWGALPSLNCLRLSGCNGLSAWGLNKLQHLQVLVMTGCPHLDYDALAAVLTCCSYLRHLDLRDSIVRINSGTTATALSEGNYQPPAAAASIRYTPDICRRDVVASNRPATAAEVLPPVAASAAADAGLQVLIMSGCHLHFAAFSWHALPQSPSTPNDPYLLLYHLLCHAKHGLSNLRVLQWSQCQQSLVCCVLCDVVPAAKHHLQVLNLSSGILPKAPSSCWQGLAAATNLKTLDISDIGFCADGIARSCFHNPTEELLASIASMHSLEELNITGWRFDVANIHVLAGLENLRGLDMSSSTGVRDETLWCLTRLSGLTKLDVSSASASNPQIWGLIFSHLSLLQHLCLRNVRNFDSSSVAGLTHLRRLTALDIKGIEAGDQSAVLDLVKLSSCKRISMSLMKPLRWVQKSGDQIAKQWERYQAFDRLGEEDASRHHDAVASSWSLSSSSMHELALQDQLKQLAFVARFKDCQSLRQLVLNTGPAVVEYCRTLLPLWIDVR